MSVEITQVTSALLEFRQGNSDKMYAAIVLKFGDLGYKVHFKYGKRHAMHNTYLEPAEPTHYGDAMLIYQKMIDKKIKKGYRLL